MHHLCTNDERSHMSQQLCLALLLQLLLHDTQDNVTDHPAEVASQ